MILAVYDPAGVIIHGGFFNLTADKNGWLAALFGKRGDNGGSFPVRGVVIPAFAGDDKIRLADLERYPFAMPAKGLQARNTFDRIVEGLDYRFKVRLEINEVNVLVDLVRSSNMLVTVISEAAIARTPGIKALTLDQQGTSMEGSFHTLKNGYMKRATREFLRMLCENRSYGMAMMDLL